MTCKEQFLTLTYSLINFDLTNLEIVGPDHGIERAELEKYSSFVSKYLQNIHKKNQGFYTAIDDQEIIKKIDDFVKQTHLKYENIVVLGIGGSALGTRCIQQSLSPIYGRQKLGYKNPRLHVIDNIDPHFIAKLEPVIDYKKTLFLVVSKSGVTFETLAHYFYFRRQCERLKLPIGEHFVFITDPYKGFLREIAQVEDIPFFPIPENVGGRFSVLTSVGLLPAKLVGINIEKLLFGARRMRDSFLSEKFSINLSFQLAALQYLLYQKGKTINVLMPYCQRLIRFTDWYAQLLAESTGKRQNREKDVFVGITPMSALGATDQHSLCQLFNEGPNDKFFIFIQVQELGREVKIDLKDYEKTTFPFFKNLSFNKLMHVEKTATVFSLTKNLRPTMTITVDRVDEEILGELFMLFQGSVAFLGEFFGIDVFNQPGIELAKKLTMQMLGDMGATRVSGNTSQSPQAL